MDNLCVLIEATGFVYWYFALLPGSGKCLRELHDSRKIQTKPMIIASPCTYMLDGLSANSEFDLYGNMVRLCRHQWALGLLE